MTCNEAALKRGWVNVLSTLHSPLLTIIMRMRSAVNSISDDVISMSSALQKWTPLSLFFLAVHLCHPSLGSSTAK